MSDEAVETVKCIRCGASYLYDDYTFCPDCDVATTVGPGLLAGAAKRVRQMRTYYQETLRAKRDGVPQPTKPEWMR